MSYCLFVRFSVTGSIEFPVDMSLHLARIYKDVTQLQRIPRRWIESPEGKLIRRDDLLQFQLVLSRLNSNWDNQGAQSSLRKSMLYWDWSRPVQESKAPTGSKSEAASMISIRIAQLSVYKICKDSGDYLKDLEVLWHKLWISEFYFQAAKRRIIKKLDR